jgi:hypothetical protein
MAALLLIVQKTLYNNIAIVYETGAQGFPLQ